MKRNVVLLVILNLVIFAYFQWVHSPSAGGRQALPDLHPEKVELLSDQALQAMPTTSGDADASPAPTEK